MEFRRQGVADGHSSFYVVLKILCIAWAVEFNSGSIRSYSLALGSSKFVRLVRSLQ